MRMDSTHSITLHESEHGPAAQGGSGWQLQSPYDDSLLLLGLSV